MTRRVINPQPSWDHDNWSWERHNGPEHEWLRACPYGKPGDMLYVRETWAGYDLDGARFRCEYLADGAHQVVDVERGRGWLPILQKASRIYPKHQPSIYMPVECARLWLRITDVRVERVCEISDEDAIAEGVSLQLYCENHCDWRGDEIDLLDPTSEYEDGDLRCPRCGSDSAILEDRPDHAFARLWDSINAKRPGCSWQDNPFCWALTYERCEAPA